MVGAGENTLLLLCDPQVPSFFSQKVEGMRLLREEVYGTQFISYET